MTAINASPLLLREVAADDDGYKITRSVRTGEGSGHFTRYSKVGDRFRFTFAGWFKKNSDGAAGLLTAGYDGNSWHQLAFNAAAELDANHHAGAGGGVKTSRSFRDPSSWYHFVWIRDQNAKAASNRNRLYINGVKQTLSGTDIGTGDSDCDFGEWNELLTLGKSGSDVFHGNFADVYYIDGLACPPSWFGKWVDGKWTPTAFTVQTPNNNTTWSSTTATPNSGAVTDFFDGNFGESAYWTTTGTDHTLTTGEFTINTTLRVFGNLNPNNTKFKINDVYTPLLTEDLGSAWYEVDLSNHTLPIDVTSLKQHFASASGISLAAIEVDGRVLEDGLTDKSNIDNRNDGTKWSSGITGTPWNAETYGFERAFDGNSHNRGTLASSGNTLTFSGSIGKAGDKIEMWFGWYPTGTDVNVVVNGTNINSQLTTETWCNITGITFPITSMTWNSYGASNYALLKAIRVNGRILIDNATDNSAHLKFTDISRDQALGRDFFHGKISDATGGLPIWNTKAGTYDPKDSDGEDVDYGEVRETTYRQDNKPGGSNGDAAGTTSGSGLVFAMPFSVNTGWPMGDEHDHINTGSSVKVLNAANNAKTVNTISKYYGTSGYLASGAATPGDAWYITDHADLAFGTGDYTVEFWFRPTHLFNNFVMYDSRANAGSWWTSSTGFSIVGNGSGQVSTYTGGAYVCQSPTNVISVNNWHHIAIVRSSGTQKIYIDGTERASASNTSDHTDQKAVIGNATNHATAGEGSKGYYQDFRLYKGTAKYTSNFTVNWRNDWYADGLDADAAQNEPLRLSTTSSTAKDDSLAHKTLTPSSSDASWVDLGSGGENLSPPTGIQYGIKHTNDAYYQLNLTQAEMDLSGDFTIEAWIYKTEDGAWRLLGTRHGGDHNYGASGFFGGNSTAGVGLGRSNVAWDLNESSGGISNNTWHHVAYCRDGSNIGIFVDGTRKAYNGSNSNDYSSTMITAPSGGAYGIGQEENGAATANMYVANMRIVTSALYSPSSGTITVPTPPLTQVTSLLNKDAAITIDTSLDSPTDYEDDSGDRSNYCVLNYHDTFPIASTPVSEGGMKFRIGGSSVYSNAAGTLGVRSGKYYYEASLVAGADNWSSEFGWLGDDSLNETAGNIWTNSSTYGWSIGNDGNLLLGASCGTDVSGYHSGGGNGKPHVMMIAADFDNGKIWFGVDGVWVGNPSTGASPAATNLLSVADNLIYRPAVGAYYATTEIHVNFGQRPWHYTCPTGFKSLCTTNIAAYAIKPKEHFDVVKYTGTGSDGNEVDGLSFQPELVWIKDTDSAGNHPRLYDAIRGVNSALMPSLNSAADQLADYGQFESFDSDGFTVGAGNTNAEGTNHTNQPHVAWCWDAGTSASGANDAGSIDIASGNQWVNTTAGFSITKYVSNNTSGATVGHGLGAPPEFIIVKNTDDASNWGIYHKGMGNTHTMWLDINNAAADAITEWNDTSPTNTVFSLGNGNTVNNASSHEYMAYCWTPIPGYSRFGKYTGNSAASGKFIYTGFKPRWVLIKNAVDTGPEAWVLLDSKRDSANPIGLELTPSTPDDEGNTNLVDFYTNGFKIRNSAKRVNDNNGGVYMISAAFAEGHTKGSLAN